MLEVVALILVLVAGGYALRKCGLVGPDTAQGLNQAILFLFLPALIFRSLHRAELGLAVGILPLAGWAAPLFGLSLGLILARIRGLSPLVAGSFALVCAFGNTTYLGYPLVRGFFGEDRLTLAIFYDLLGATLAVNTLGVLVATRASRAKDVSANKEELGPRPQAGLREGSSLVRRLLSLPTVWALAVALAGRGLPVPPLVDHLLEQIGNLTVPCSMLMFGMALRLRDWRHHWPLVLVAAVVKLVVIPVVVWGSFRAVGLPVAFQQAAVLESGMPTMFYSLNLAIFFGLDTTLVLNAIGFSSLLCVATLPVWSRLLAP